MASAVNEVPFSIHEVGDVTEKTYTGEFRAKVRLSHRDQLRKDQVRREILGGQPGVPGDRALTTSMILSELAVRLTSVPEWWTDSAGGLDLEDDNVIGKVYDAAMKVEGDAVEAKKKKAEAEQKRLRDEAAKKTAEENP